MQKGCETGGGRMQYRSGVLLVMGAGVVWSFQALIIRQIEVSNAWTVLFWRSLAMSFATFVFLAWRTRGAPLPALRRAGGSAALGGVGLVVAMAGAILAFQNTSVANASFLFAASPFIAAMLGRVFLHEKVAPQTVIAIAVAMAGVLIMVSDGLASGAWIGNLAALASAIGFAAFTVTLRWSHSTDSTPATVLGGIFSVLTALVIARAWHYPLLVSPRDIGWCLLMGSGTLTGGMILYTLGSKSVPSAELALLSNTEVMLAPVWVWLILGETARFQTLLGGAILLVAIVFNALVGVRRGMQIA